MDDEFPALVHASRERRNETDHQRVWIRAPQRRGRATAASSGGRDSDLRGPSHRSNDNMCTVRNVKYKIKITSGSSRQRQRFEFCV